MHGVVRCMESPLGNVDGLFGIAACVMGYRFTIFCSSMCIERECRIVFQPEFANGILTMARWRHVDVFSSARVRNELDAFGQSPQIKMSYRWSPVASFA